MNKTNNFRQQRISLIWWPCCHSIPDRCHKGATDKSSSDLFYFIYDFAYNIAKQLCPNGHQIIIKNIFLPVSYCLLTETLSNYNWVTIRQSCGVSERTTKEKKTTLKKWKLVLFKYLTMKSKALAPRQHVLPPTKSSDQKLGKLSGQYERIFVSKKLQSNTS